jgi:hypothetical protein
MTGIIINDSIVLVSTVDEYAKERGLIPAILDATSDRLRPVFLTTATTVLGLAPLMYEASTQAQFLKPTVITLVYGLGFGMVLVLLVVPAILAMQLDVARQVAAARRALRLPGRARPVALAVGSLAAGYVALFAATLGSAALTGALPSQLTTALPALAAAPALATGLGLFLLGSLALTALVWIVSVAVVFERRRRAAA